MKADPTKFRDIINPHWSWDCELDFNKPDQKVSDMFLSLLCDVKLLGYLKRDYAKMIEKLFRNLMEQNPEVPKMEWHFCGECPYCLSINQSDLQQQYAVKVTQGVRNSAYYYDPPAPESDDTFPIFNKERYLAAYPKHMKDPQELVSLAGQVEDQFEFLTKNPLLGNMYLQQGLRDLYNL